jgi:hypothetical protein
MNTQTVVQSPASQLTGTLPGLVNTAVDIDITSQSGILDLERQLSLIEARCADIRRALKKHKAIVFALKATK